MSNRLDETFCRDISRSSRLEWLETNGKGAFAMGTVAGINTRRYHGLLTASMRPPAERYLLLGRLEELVNNTYISTCQYPGVIAPDGCRSLQSFTRDPFLHWTFRLPQGLIHRELFLVPGQNTVVITYRSEFDGTIVIQPMLAFREYHSVTRKNSRFNPNLQLHNNGFTIQPYDNLPPLHLHVTEAEFIEKPDWYKNLEYLREMERGLEWHEDLFCPGSFSLNLKAGVESFLVASTEQLQVTPEWCASKKVSRTFATPLEAAADQFLVTRADGKPTIIAGYPWFTDWGRDTMISLVAYPQVAPKIIGSFLEHLHEGLIPNRFPDAGEQPEYNTVDATLWMFQAVYAYLETTTDESFLRNVFFPKAKEIIEWHRRGTRYGIQVDPVDGLLSAGELGVQLTWMDAKVGDWVVTPRHGKPVEINALWVNALYLTSRWALQLGEKEYGETCAAEGNRARESFAKKFWNKDRNCLYDVLSANGPDSAIRPNQIIACSLPYPLLDSAQQQAVVRMVERELLTPFGLRTLETSHLEYRGHYRGNPLERDGAYHQGTVWPWLIGPFVKAYLNAFGRTPDTLRYCRRLLDPLLGELYTNCFGSISEVYDGNAPHAAGGAPAQAWSVAQLLEAVRITK